MEAGESSAVSGRRRTNSNEGNSDSDLSDGWNLVDELDIQNNDVPSSDGESVEVIEAEEETSDHGRNVIQELSAKPTAGTSELVAKSECPLVPATGREPLTPTAGHRPGREEMFDSSFCWFLFFAAVAVIFSNLAFMAADNVVNWNVSLGTVAPSFLSDLPTMPKPVQQDTSHKVMSWTNSDISVETVGDSVVIEKENKRSQRAENNNNKDKIKYHKKYNKINAEKLQKEPLKTDSHDIVKYFKVLSEMTSSTEARNKFSQALLVLDALHIGLNDLEEVVAENSELKQVLRKQQNKLQDVISEVDFGVSRSLERLATNVLNKLQKLESKFENQWCKLEKNGHKEELKGLFYDCLDNEERNMYDDVGSKEMKQTEEKIGLNELNKKKQMIVENYEYEVDKDSAGKLYSKPNSGAKQSDDYYKFLTSKKYDNQKYKKEHKEGHQEKYEKYNKHNEDGRNSKGKHFTDSNHKFTKNEDHVKYKHDKLDRKDAKHKQRKSDKKVSNNKHTELNEKKMEEFSKHIHNSKFHETKKENIVVDKRQQTDNRENLKSMHKKHNKDKVKQDEKSEIYYTEEDEFDINKTTLEMVSKYLKEKCEKNRNMVKTAFNFNDYQIIKDGIDDQVRIHKRIFDKLYEKYCKPHFNNLKWDSKSKKEYLKGDKIKQNLFKNSPLIIENSNPLTKNIVEFKIVEAPNVNDVEVDSVNSKVILPNTNAGRQWLFSYEEPSSDNKTDLSGDWFIKAGESRAHSRWSHSRSDWVFDRASHRRNHPQTPSWLLERRKNWFFLRAWARHRCRQTPQDAWCHIPQEENINFSGSNSNFR